MHSTLAGKGLQRIDFTGVKCLASVEVFLINAVHILAACKKQQT
jgi:hypothetical protein